MDTAKPAASRKFKWKYPLIIIVSACLVVFLGFGTRTIMGVFLVPISEHFEWGRSIFAFAAAVQNLVWGFSQPIFGAVADRYGSGRVIIFGGLCYVAGLVIMTISSSPAGFFISNGVLIGLGLSGTTFAVVLAVIARNVSERHRSMALGVGAAAGSLGQFILVPVANWLIESYGWIYAILVFAVMVCSVIPLAGILSGKHEVSGPEQTLKEAIKQASRHSGYVYLTSGFFVCGFQVSFIGIHMPAYLTDVGLPSHIGAWALSLVGIFNLLGTLIAGYLGRFYLKKSLLSWIYLGRAITISVFVLVPPSSVTALVFASCIGILWLATVPLTSGIVSQIFGPRYLGTLFGFVFFSHQIGSFLGVWLGGVLFDTTQSYEIVWWMCVALGVLAAILHWPIDERPLVRARTETA